MRNTLHPVYLIYISLNCQFKSFVHLQRCNMFFILRGFLLRHDKFLSLFLCFSAFSSDHRYETWKTAFIFHVGGDRVKLASLRAYTNMRGGQDIKQDIHRAFPLAASQDRSQRVNFKHIAGCQPTDEIVLRGCGPIRSRLLAMANVIYLISFSQA